MGKNVKVGFLVSCWGDSGGAVRVAVNLANKMADDYEVHFLELYGVGRSCAFSLDPRVLTKSLLEGESYRLSELVTKGRRPLRAYLSERRIDVMFLVGTYPGALSLMLGPMRRTKVVFCDHGAIANQLSDKQITLVRRIAPWLCAKTVSLTKRNEQDYQRILHVPAARVTTIPNWIPSTLWERETLYDVESKAAVWAGRLDPEKGFDHLLDIASKAQSALRRTGWRIDVYGESVLSKGVDYSEEIVERGLEDVVVLKGSVDDLYERYPSYGISLLTSYREGLPLVLLESQACGLPSLSFDVVTGPSDIIVDGENGFLIEPFDCDAYARRLVQLVEDPLLRKRLAGRTRRVVEKFSEDAVYPQWTRLIEELVR